MTEPPRSGTALETLRPSPPRSGHKEAPLRGRRIALSGDDGLEGLAALLHKLGATVIQRPRLVPRDATDPLVVERWLKDLVAGAIDQVVLLSEDSVDQLALAAERLGLTVQMRGALRSIYKVVRGPKPGHALHRMGLDANLTSPPSLAGLMACLARQGGHAGRRIGLQLFPDDPTPHLVAFLEGLGASVLPVAPRREGLAGGDEEARTFITGLGRGQFDGTTFSAPLEVTHLFEMAAQQALEPVLRAGLASVVVAATDRVTAECLQGFGVRVDLVPRRTYSLLGLCRAFAARLRPPPIEPDRGPSRFSE
jgi:uroporphyrinogen-III synthase